MQTQIEHIQGGYICKVKALLSDTHRLVHGLSVACRCMHFWYASISSIVVSVVGSAEFRKTRGDTTDLGHTRSHKEVHTHTHANTHRVAARYTQCSCLQSTYFVPHRWVTSRNYHTKNGNGVSFNVVSRQLPLCLVSECRGPLKPFQMGGS